MSSETKGKEELLMLYDGKCNVCNWAVQFSLNRIADNAIMRYASLQSEFAAKTLKKLDVNCFEDEKNPDVPTTSAVIHRGKVSRDYDTCCFLHPDKDDMIQLLLYSRVFS